LHENYNADKLEFVGEIMKKRACVFMFSGTGLTSYVVSKIQSELEKMDMSLDVCIIEKTNIREIQIQDYDMIGIAYPVHAFNAPKIVIDFVKQLPNSKRLKAFILSSAGDKSFINFASSNKLTQILQKKNYDVFYNKQFVMPCNFIIKNDEETVTERLNVISKEAVLTANAICDTNDYKMSPNFIAKLFSLIGRIEWITAKGMSKYFYTDNQCDSCLHCVNLCPNKNITPVEESITFGKNCGLCMRCIYNCPRSAIKIRGVCKFFSIGSWYENDDIKYKVQ